MILAAYLHNLDPFALRFTGEWGIRWYGLSYLMGFLAGYLLTKRIAKVGKNTILLDEVSDLVVTVSLGVILGGRLGFVLFYQPSLLQIDMAHGAPYWGVLKMQQGGMSSHGGMIGCLIASWLFSYWRKYSWSHLLDLISFGAPAGLFFGRIANFINGELYGRQCPKDFSLAVQFPQEIPSWNHDIVDHSQQLQNLQDSLPAPYQSDPKYQGIMGLYDALMKELHNHNPQVIKALHDNLTPRYPSQLFEAVMEGLVVFAVVAFLYRKPQKPLVITGAFAIVYGVVRIVGEQFRTPDDYIGFQNIAGLEVTRGQILSVALVLIGVTLLIIGLRRKTEPAGGWMRSKSPDRTTVAGDAH